MTTKLWKRNAVIAVVLLFICVGVYLNWSYSREKTADEAAATLGDTLDLGLLEQKEQETAEYGDGTTSVDAMMDDVVVVNDGGEYEALLTEAQTDTTMDDYFASIRLARQESRDSAVNLLQETMAYEDGTETETAAAASAELEDMMTAALKEAEIEGLVIAKGYTDCVAYMGEGGISVAVAAPEFGLEADAVAQICDIVTTQSGYSPSELKIIEVK